MYVPKHNQELQAGVLHALIRSHPLGTWITQADGELVVNHIPFLFDAGRGEHGTLVAHVARANPVWRSFSASAPSVVVFQGAQTYVTPSWYPSKQKHGKAVPTWNYAVVHAHGLPRAIDDPDWLRGHVSELTRTHEAERAAPWQVTDAPADFIDQMLAAIVGIEIPLSKLEGKWKVSQNRPSADRRGVVRGLVAQGDDSSLEMADMVRRFL